MPPYCCAPLGCPTVRAHGALQSSQSGAAFQNPSSASPYRGSGCDGISQVRRSSAHCSTCSCCADCLLVRVCIIDTTPYCCSVGHCTWTLPLPHSIILSFMNPFSIWTSLFRRRTALSSSPFKIVHMWHVRKYLIETTLCTSTVFSELFMF